jgi:flagellar hook-associated protein 1 FlgK
MLGDANQAGSINTFAKTLADTVNGILTSGTVGPQSGAANGLPLFTYNAADATLSAGSLKVNASITAADLAPVDSTGNANGNALQLASLANSIASGSVGGQTFGAFFSGIMSGLGNESAMANTNQQAQQSVADQAKAMRDQISGVSLDQQAIALSQFQKSYEAAAKMVTVLDQLTQTTIDMLQR